MVAQLVKRNRANRLSILFMTYPLNSIVRSQRGYVKKFSLTDELSFRFLKETFYRTKVVR